MQGKVTKGNFPFPASPDFIMGVAGCPCFSYMATKKQGSITTIIAIAARLVPALSLSKKKSGSPIRSAAEKQRICRFVRLKATFVLTLDKSLGTGTYAKKKPPFCGTFPLVLC